jgi:hypothetical protein
MIFLTYFYLQKNVEVHPKYLKIYSLNKSMRNNDKIIDYDV